MRGLVLVAAALCGCGGDDAATRVVITSGSWLAPPRSDASVCRIVRLPHALDVVRIDATLTTGAHHLLLSRVTAGEPSDALAPCDATDALDGDVPLFIADGTTASLALPSGVAHHFDAGALVQLQLHALNATDAPLAISGTLTLTTTHAATTRADVMMCGSVTPLVNAGLPAKTPWVTLPPGFFAGDDAVDFTTLHVFALATSQHWTGQRATIAKSASADDAGLLVYENTSWDAAPLAALPGGGELTFAPGEGLRWQCAYDTIDAAPPPADPVRFGARLRGDEVCFVWAHYWPAAAQPIGRDRCWQ